MKIIHLPFHLTHNKTGKSWRIRKLRNGQFLARRFGQKQRFKSLDALYRVFYDKTGVLTPTTSGNPWLPDDSVPPEQFTGEVDAICSECRWNGARFQFCNKRPVSYTADPCTSLDAGSITITQEHLDALPPYVRDFYQHSGLVGKQVDIDEFLKQMFFRLSPKPASSAYTWLEDGAGVCRHRAALLGAWLVAFGYNVEYAFSSADCHMWLIVDGMDYDPLLGEVPTPDEQMPLDVCCPEAQLRCGHCGKNNVGTSSWFADFCTCNVPEQDDEYLSEYDDYGGPGDSDSNSEKEERCWGGL